MAQTMSSAAVGRVNRRFLFLALILATLSAVLVYAAISRSDSGGGGGGAAGDISVVVAKAPIAAGVTVTADMVVVRSLPANGVGEGAFRTIDAAVGQVARYPIAANEQLLLSKVVGGLEIGTNDVLSHIIEVGKRGMAIKVEAVVNAGGLVLPGDHVDIYWAPEEVDEDLVGAGLIAENVEVLAVQQTLEDISPTAPGLTKEGETNTAANGERIRASEAAPIPDAATVTLLLTPEQAARVFCASADRGPIRLAVRAFGDDSPSGLPLGECIIKAKKDEVVQ